MKYLDKKFNSKDFLILVSVFSCVFGIGILYIIDKKDIIVAPALKWFHMSI